MAVPLGQVVMTVVLRRWVGRLRSRGSSSESAYGQGTQRIFAYFFAVNRQSRGLLQDEALGCRRCTGSAAQWNEAATLEARRVVILC